MTSVQTVIAIDAMGGDNAPGEIIAGAKTASKDPELRIILVGDETRLATDLPDNISIIHASEVIEMHEDPASGVRNKKDASVVRCAELVKDGQANAMVSAGNTGAAMAAALMKFGRLPGVTRPAIAVPVPVPNSEPQLLVDGGSTVDCEPEWLVQWAHMAAAYARIRQHTDNPTVGLLSIGEEAGKGDKLRKAAYPLMAGVPGFIGNIEGRELVSDHPNVVITDGFTGNVALKTMERTLHAVSQLVLETLDSTPEAKQASEILLPLLFEAAAKVHPDSVGGAMLLGVDGVCVISHGSSNAHAIVNATKVAKESVERDVVGQMKSAVSHAG